MSCRLPAGMLAVVLLVSWTSASPARAAAPAPPALAWTNYLGSEKDDSFGDIVRDPGTGEVFVTGTIPRNPSGGILTARFSAEGTFGAWRILSGNVVEGSRAIALGKDGLFIAGYSRSNQFENNSSLLLSPGTRGEQDGLVALLNPEDLTVRWVYLIDFGNGAEVINDLVITKDGSVVVVGVTAPTVSELDSAAKSTDVFVVRLTPPRQQQMIREDWRHRSPGSDADVAFAVALDESETIYFAGKTKSANLREDNTFGLPYTGGGTFDGFIMKREQNGTFVAGTHFGGQGQDSVNGLVIQNETIFVAGTSSSAQLPKATNSSGTFSRAFAASFEPGTMGHVNTVTLGTGKFGNDEGRALAFVGDQLYMGGIVGSQDFPGMEFPTPFQPYKGFVAKVDLSEMGPSPTTPSIVGGNRNDRVLGLSGASVNGGPVLFVGGTTTSSNLGPSGRPVPPYTSEWRGGEDMFFGQMDFNPPPPAPDGGSTGDGGGGGPGGPGGSEDDGSAGDGGMGGPDGGSGPRSPLGFSCGANASGGGPGVMALGSLLGLALLTAARRGRLPPRG